MTGAIFIFMNLSPRRQAFLHNVLVPGGRAQGLRKHVGASARGPGIEAQEMWSSMIGDSIVIENAVIASTDSIAKSTLLAFRESRPAKENQEVCGENEFGQLILFLANVQSQVLKCVSFWRSLKSCSLELPYEHQSREFLPKTSSRPCDSARFTADF